MPPRDLRKSIAAFGALAAVAASLLVAHDGAAAFAVTFLAPHVARPPAATLDPDFARAAGDLVRFALHETGDALHFGLAHPTRLAFDAHEREGNCIEYAHLFARVFDRAAAAHHVDARAYVVHSAARVFGRRLDVPGFDDHDWVLVVSHARGPGAAKLFVDPTLADADLDWDIARSVVGEVRVP
jgi:hypothetical protein